MLLFPHLRTQDEARALAALAPVAAPHSLLVRRWAWPMPRQWGSFGAGPGQFNKPWGLATTAGGDIVVCDSGNDRIQVYRPDGMFVREWGSQGVALGQFRFPCCVAVSSTGDIYVADCHNNRIQVFGPDGGFLYSWGSDGRAPGQFLCPNGVAVHGNLVLVSDQGNHRIQCFGLVGSFVRMWGSRGVAPGQFKGAPPRPCSVGGRRGVCLR